MKPLIDEFTIFVICDSPRHEKSQAITNFVRVDGGEWREVYSGKSRSGGDNAVTLVGSSLADAIEHDLSDRDYWSQARAVYEFECRKCKGARRLSSPPFQWQRTTLWRVFDAAFDEYRKSYGAVGVLPLSLSAISARVGSLPQA